MDLSELKKLQYLKKELQGSRYYGGWKFFD